MKIIKNISNESLTVGGVLIPSGNSYSCLMREEEVYFANSDAFILALTQNKLEVYNDTLKISGVSNAINFLKGELVDSAGVPVLVQMPFASKTMNGKKLFKRVHGMQVNCVQGENIFEFVIPYGQVKINGLEMIGGQNNDKVDLEVYDTPTGLVSGFPNVKLNQFGFSVNVSKDFYEHKSEYDADLFLNMKLEVHYFAQQAGLIGINFLLNELK